MKAFLMSVAALLLITVVSALVLQAMPNSSARDVYTDRSNVRL